MSAEPEEIKPAATRAGGPAAGQRARASTAAPPAAATVVPEAGEQAPPARVRKPGRVAARATLPAAGPRPPRRVRQTIKKVDLWSVLKVSLCFYLCEMVVVVVALASLWLIADSFGIINHVEKFIGDLVSSKDFHFLSAGMFRGLALVALVLVALQVVATVIAAAFYNLFAELFGGIEVTVMLEDAPAKR
jgi:Transmembrane domain of unknown function (DUF3566)